MHWSKKHRVQLPENTDLGVGRVDYHVVSITKMKMEMYLLSLIFCFALHPLAQVFVKAEAANHCQWQGAGENYFGHCWDLYTILCSRRCE